MAYYSVVWENPKGSGNIGVINAKSMVGWFPQVGGSKYLLNILIVAALTIGMYIYLRYSKQGYEIAVVGRVSAPPATSASRSTGSSSVPWSSPVPSAVSPAFCW